MPSDLLTRSIAGLSPFERPDGPVVVSLCRAGALGILDLGRDGRAARAALATVASQAPDGFGVRVPEGASFDPAQLPPAALVVLLPAGADLAPWRGRDVLVQVTSLEEALAAERAGAAGLVAKGAESGGRVGEETAFVLLQRLVPRVKLPIWVQGGVGLRSAAACIAGGARGVLLDAQLALTRESSLPPAVKTAIASMDGSETALVGGLRVYARPGSDLGGLPVGQDAALARGLADRFVTAGGVARGLARLVGRQLKEARELAPLRPGSPLAASHALRFPIFQGPMTRVSDRAAFADAVSHAGALPFLALALMRGDEVRRLLEETKARLGDRTFGVGILGFVPPELRAEQLAAVTEFRPPVALIAGGRPSQARELEERGTRTYLHVPSPGLLDLFLEEGARRFVFEGRECGGHVGPRSSFVLWEQAVARLLEADEPEELSCVFAGGIHDARSAAMVSALAAPLAARGVRVGVLMGTAYLFTREAVATGAIEPGFQEAAIACERTVLLETAPGHATRCVETDYVRAFRAEKERLEKEGKPPQEAWAALEQLNLGRLRIAAKGLRREGEQLVKVPAEEQRREGMYMIGQVAALRDHVLGAEELHREVCEGAGDLLASLRVNEPAAKEARPADVAIVGIGCVFPRSPDARAFWQNVVGGVNAVTEVPATRWNPELYWDPESQDGAKTPSKWGGFLPDVPFDPVAYGIPPRSLGAIEPVQLLALEVARRALADAGYAEREFDRERTSVIFGAEAGTDLSSQYGFRALFPQLAGALPAALDEHLPKLTEDSFPGILSNVIAGRIANRLDLGGVNYTVDAACASSLAALDLAVKELAAGTSDMVLCGGADLHNGIADFLLFSAVHALSPTGLCRTFDSAADGIVLGEGVACLVLKRVADAERDGDRIYAVVKGIAGASDGRSLGLTAPRKEGQVRALERAYRQAGVSPAEVGLVEAHGTGTVVGDRTELATLTEVFARAGAKPGQAALGSVKSQIGHTKCAAGLAGLVKAALSLHHRVLPPTLNVVKPNAYYDPSASPFTLSDVARPWPGEARNAAVSAFGFGGTNFHAVLAEYERAEPPATGGQAWPAELFLFRGADHAAALAAIDEVARCAAAGGYRLCDLARTVAAQGSGPVQVAVVASALEDLAKKLGHARRFEADPSGVFVPRVPPGKVAFLFPGQGSQRPGMLGELFVAFPALQRHLRAGAKWAPKIFPPTAFTPEEKAAQAAALTDTRVAQPALGIAGLAVAELLSTLGVSPDLAGGHSYGELVALCAAGAIAPGELLTLSEARAECILAAAGSDPGAMAAVSGPAAAVEEAVRGCGVVLANHNSPDQAVIAGPTPAVERALAQLAERKLAAKKLQVACAFHSPVVAAAAQTFGAKLAQARLAPPAIPVFANVTAAPYDGDVRGLLARQLAMPVRFAEEVEAMYAAGARVFVEAGPGSVLTRLVGKILGDRPHVAVAVEQPGKPATLSLLGALAELAVHGAPVNPTPLFAGRDARVLDLAAPPPDALPPTAWLVNGQLARPIHGEPPPNGLKLTDRPLVSGPGLAAPSGEREEAVREFIHTMREMADAQRQVMLRFLGGEPAPRAATAPAPRPSPAAKPAPAQKPPPAPAAASPMANGAPDTTSALLSIVSERTGYPVEMLNLESDLEAELSIDSIKRVEILGLLAARLGLAAGGGLDSAMEQLAAIKTLKGIVAFLESKMGRAGKNAAVPPAARVPARAELATPAAVTRYEIGWAEAPLPGVHEPLEGKELAIVADGGELAAALSALLEARGAKVSRVRVEDPLPAADGVLFLPTLAPAPHGVKALFERAREALAGRAKLFVAACPAGGGGAPGFMKSLARERPELRVRAVELDLAESPTALADHLFAEATSADSRAHTRWHGGRRLAPRVEAMALNGGTSLELGPDSVVVVTGGARGVTAKAAVALARRFRCRLELAGRSALRDEDPALAAALDAPALRKALLASRPGAPLVEVEGAVHATLAAREVRSTLAAIEAAGGRAGYRALDARDPEAFLALLHAARAEHGRLDGVVHGAGVIEDKLLDMKSRESFDRVFDTKVASALALATSPPPGLRFAAFFGSVSGVFGNRGQCDYAAANDVLDAVARSLAHKLPRALSVDWGPWSGAGMVSPELAREYARRGVALLPAEAAAEAFVDELVRGSASQVLLSAAPPEVFGDHE